MKPVSPVLEKGILEELGLKEVIYAENQSQYLQLPAVKLGDGCVISRWQLSFMERIKILLTGTLFLEVMTFNNPLQPLRPTVGKIKLL